MGEASALLLCSLPTQVDFKHGYTLWKRVGPQLSPVVLQVLCLGFPCNTRKVICFQQKSCEDILVTGLPYGQKILTWWLQNMETERQKKQPAVGPGSFSCFLSHALGGLKWSQRLYMEPKTNPAVGPGSVILTHTLGGTSKFRLNAGPGHCLPRRHRRYPRRSRCRPWRRCRWRRCAPCRPRRRRRPPWRCRRRRRGSGAMSKVAKVCASSSVVQWHPFFPCFFGGCPTKNGLAHKGFPFFSGVTDQLSFKQWYNSWVAPNWEMGSQEKGEMFHKKWGRGVHVMALYVSPVCFRERPYCGWTKSCTT